MALNIDVLLSVIMLHVAHQAIVLCVIMLNGAVPHALAISVALNRGKD